MGTLIAMAYPTPLVANQADHTYVKCGTGQKAWGCWGGKTGGREVRRGTGSTRQADAIAETKERAGITCYAINGVCHQAANRVLWPAGITVRGARGYKVSEALFGTYGRVGFWPCRAPFHRHEGVAGDLEECIPSPDEIARVEMDSAGSPTDDDKRWSGYIQSVVEMYDQAAPMMMAEAVDAGDAGDFSVKLFIHMAQFNLENMLDDSLSANLADVRGKIEETRFKAEAAYANHEMQVREFVDDFNKTTIAFQDEMAGILKPEQYQTLFDLNPEERVLLVDEEIVKTTFDLQ